MQNVFLIFLFFIFVLSMFAIFQRTSNESANEMSIFFNGKQM